jgi:hypothetical protein
VHEDRDGDGKTDLIHHDVDGDGVLDLVSLEWARVEELRVDRDR